MSELDYMGYVIYTTSYRDGNKMKTGYKIRGLSGSHKTLAGAKKAIRTEVRKSGRGIGHRIKKLFGKRK